MNLKTTGFYKEMPHAIEAKESILEFIDKGNCADIDKVCTYLKSGIELIISPSVTKDLINPEKGTSGTASLYTDGMWVWPGDLAYYVKNYNLRLSDAFLATMVSNEWKVNLKETDLNFDMIEINNRRIG